ncbi:hypothetical protein [Bacillus cereus]|nr:hypothetical protein [Bacillus cereus]
MLADRTYSYQESQKTIDKSIK